MQVLLKIIYFVTGLSKSIKKVNFIFSFEPSPFYWAKLSKQKGLGTSDQSLLRLQNKYRKIPLLVIYCLTKFDEVIQSAVYSLSYSTSIFPFESGKGGKDGKILQKFEYL